MLPSDEFHTPYQHLVLSLEPWILYCMAVLGWTCFFIVNPKWSSFTKQAKTWKFLTRHFLYLCVSSLLRELQISCRFWVVMDYCSKQFLPFQLNSGGWTIKRFTWTWDWSRDFCICQRCCKCGLRTWGS